jgi:hypothetical protein
VCTFAADPQQLGPANNFVHDGEAVPFLLLRRLQRFDRAVKQAHQAADVARARDVAPLLRLPCAGEQAADQLVRHIQQRIGQSGFEVDDIGGQDRPPAGRGVAPDLVRIGNPPFPDELLKTVIVDPRRSIRGEPNVAHKPQPFDQLG